MRSIFNRKPKQVEVTHILQQYIDGNENPLKIQVNLGPRVMQDVGPVLKSYLQLRERERQTPSVETKLILCRGANSQLDEVTAMLTVERRAITDVRCPRYKNGIDFLNQDGQQKYGETLRVCYAKGDVEHIPAVKKENFVEHGIFECPYAH